MNPAQAQHALAAGISAAPLAAAAISPSLPWEAAVLSTLVFCAGYLLTRARPGRALYLSATGLLPVVACASAALPAGVAVFWMLAGLVAIETGICAARSDILPFFAFCLVSGAVALVARLSPHADLPLAALAGATALFLAVRMVREYRFRKQYRGAVT